MPAAEYETVTPADVLGLLNEIEAKYAPPTLFLARNRDLLHRGSRVSIVGSRKATPEGLQRARQLSRSLAEHSVVVVSGPAAGIDRAAHEGTIEAGGRTIAVLQTGVHPDVFAPGG